MRKKLLALSCIGIAVAACSENATAPSPQMSSRLPASVVGGQSHVMSLRGAMSSSGVGANAPGINYHGGPIVPSMKVQAMYWGTSAIYAGGPAPGTTGTGAQDGSLVGHFLRNLAPSPYYNINTTYTDNLGGGHTVANSVAYTGFWANNTNVPPANGSTVSDATMQAALIAGFNSGKLTYDAQTIYTIFTAGNTNLGGGFGSQYCAYHGFFTFNGQVVIYSAQPFVGVFLNGCSNGTPAPNGDAAADAEVNVLAHEIEEANTDPQLNAWWDSFSGQENADKCAWTWGTTYSNGTGTANMNLGGKDFLVQQNWINQANGACAKSFGGGSNQPPVAAYTATCNASHFCTFDGTSSHDPDGTIVGYKWIVAGKTVSTASVITRTFPRTRNVVITLTVTDNGGATGTITKTVAVP